MTPLLELRKRAKISQAYIAKELGVTQGAVSQWEQGLTKPGTDKLWQLAKLFNCTIDELFEQKETPPRRTG